MKYISIQSPSWSRISAIPTRGYRLTEAASTPSTPLLLAYSHSPPTLSGEFTVTKAAVLRVNQVSCPIPYFSPFDVILSNSDFKAALPGEAIGEGREWGELMRALRCGDSFNEDAIVFARRWIDWKREQSSDGGDYLHMSHLHLCRFSEVIRLGDNYYGLGVDYLAFPDCIYPVNHLASIYIHLTSNQSLFPTPSDCPVIPEWWSRGQRPVYPQPLRLFELQTC